MNDKTLNKLSILAKMVNKKLKYFGLLSLGSIVGGVIAYFSAKKLVRNVKLLYKLRSMEIDDIESLQEEVKRAFEGKSQEEKRNFKASRVFRGVITSDKCITDDSKHNKYLEAIFTGYAISSNRKRIRRIYSNRRHPINEIDWYVKDVKSSASYLLDSSVRSELGDLYTLEYMKRSMDELGVFEKICLG